MTTIKGAAYPSSVFDSTNLITVSSNFTGVPLELLESDIELLLSTYLAQHIHDFDTFDSIWNLLRFDYIHLVCLHRQNREGFMNTLYQVVLDHFDCNVDSIKFGVFYALYFLYCSQPSIWELHDIRVTKDLWMKLFAFYIFCCEKDKTEYAQAAMIFKKLKDEKNAFSFVVEQKLENPNILERKEKEESTSIMEEYKELIKDKLSNDATSICYGSDSKEIDELFEAYRYIKDLAYSTPQATLTTQQWLKKKMNVNENNLEQLQKVMVKNILKPGESTLGDDMRETGRVMWEERAIASIRDLDILNEYKSTTSKPKRQRVSNDNNNNIDSKNNDNNNNNNNNNNNQN